MKVMIVDDCSEMRDLIRMLLVGVASEFVECASGEQAVAAYGTERPDWTVMDLVMGGMDGLKATQVITSRHPGSQIVVTTQHNHPKLRERAMEMGARGFLPKEDLVDLKCFLIKAAGKDGGIQQVTSSAASKEPQTKETENEL